MVFNRNEMTDKENTNNSTKTLKVQDKTILNALNSSR